MESWQDAFGFSQAWRVDGAQSMVFVAGQGGLTYAPGRAERSPTRQSATPSPQPPSITIS